MGIFNKKGEATHLYTAITIGPGDKTATHVQVLGALPDDNCKCQWHPNTGVHGNDITKKVVSSQSDCCALCRSTISCVAVVFVQESRLCHIKHDTELVSRNGSMACLPMTVV